MIKHWYNMFQVVVIGCSVFGYRYQIGLDSLRKSTFPTSVLSIWPAFPPTFSPVPAADLLSCWWRESLKNVAVPIVRIKWEKVLISPFSKEEDGEGPSAVPIETLQEGNNNNLGLSDIVSKHCGIRSQLWLFLTSSPTVSLAWRSPRAISWLTGTLDLSQWAWGTTLVWRTCFALFIWNFILHLRVCCFSTLVLWDS